MSYHNSPASLQLTRCKYDLFFDQYEESKLVMLLMTLVNGTKITETAQRP